MAAEALQILNLSPIPELSEVELSNVLEQFSGLSEFTGELTDRNVEDILREAEELLDMSSSVKEISEDIAQSNINKSSENNSDSIEKVESIREEIYSAETKVQELNNEILNSPKQILSHRNESPSDSKNHIKSTIDSLKEYSNLIESQISSKANEKDKSKESDMKVASKNIELKATSNVKLKKANSVAIQKKAVSTPGLPKNYLSNHNSKLKASEKLNKAHNIRKSFNDFKFKPAALPLKNKNQNKANFEKKKTSLTSFAQKISNSESRQVNDYTVENDSELDLQKCIALLDKEAVAQSDSETRFNLNYPHLAGQILQQSKESISLLQKEIADLKAHLVKDKINDRSKWNSELAQKFWAQEDLIQTLKEENSKLFQEIKEIKGQINLQQPNYQSEKMMKEKEEMIQNLRSEIESLRNAINPIKPGNNSEFSRLEEQFEIIKDKYNQQIGKLELENKELREALHHRDSSNQGRDIIMDPSPKHVGIQTDKSPVSKPTKLIRSTSFEYWRTGKSKTWENVRAAENSKEAFCQTERQRPNQSPLKDLTEEIKPQNEKKLGVLESRKVENKENVAAETKKVSKQSNNFTNLDPILNSMKTKKAATEHENHLMATLRGLHAEVLAKDKENKVLKKELENLRNQARKFTGNAGKKKVEAKKKTHAGVQTIGLGPCVPLAYDPAMFQVSKQLENVNEELQMKIKALEDKCSQLEEKRTSDLRILQEIHEEEMAKLVSKLETQTALSKHLHTLLLNR